MEVQNRNVRTRVDRLTSLPYDLLIKILSLLPTKDVASLSVISKRIRRIFPLITTLDFDSLPASHRFKALKHPYAIQRLPAFVTFVNNVLQQYRSQHLKRFRLHISRADRITTPYSNGCRHLLDLEFTHLEKWISFPLTFSGLRELDLCILVKKPDEAQLPPAIFTCETLEVLKLQVNIGLDQVITMPVYRLPNLKQLLLLTSFIPDDDLLPRLVSSCPSLEDLTFQALPNHTLKKIIYPTSLRRLCMYMNRLESIASDNNDLVHFSYPDSECLEFMDNSRCMCSIPKIPSFVKEALTFPEILLYEEIQFSCKQISTLLKPLSYVQHLSLLGWFFLGFDCENEKVLMDQLPVFHNLKHLELSFCGENHCWDKFLQPLLFHSPVLETLVLPWGLMSSDPRQCFAYPGYRSKLQELKLECFRAASAIPSCCRYHLKRIVIKEYYGSFNREVEITKYFLRQALVLEELVIFRAQKSRIPFPDKRSIETTLKNYPRASSTCSIQVL
ncbi:F-box/FBD/LRR-repeat protein At5g56420-like [Chenopodium quinoa]|uniref:F-box/FBD/LRR-repeat protein At5g56420-like n=1 Tax=Chenopodium quinoa TaxID=63459 RepID=UPI000B780997|nr:F-box/FBD/LRR-repeat protein At5g56420-like [Chenopodium quinoa]